MAVHAVAPRSPPTPLLGKYTNCVSRAKTPNEILTSVFSDNGATNEVTPATARSQQSWANPPSARARSVGTCPLLA